MHRLFHVVPSRITAVAGLGLLLSLALVGAAGAEASTAPSPTAQRESVSAGSLPAASPATVADELRFENGFVREMPPGHPVSGAFFSLVNPSDRAIRIVGARCDCADSVELHAHRHTDGAVRMEAVTAVEVPPGGRFDFQPGGHHVMLIGLTRPLRAGDDVVLTLVDADQNEYRGRLPVMRAGDAGTATGGGGHHH